MSKPSEDDPKALQRDVQRLLGRCLLRLQQYERLIKTLVAHGAFSATVGNLEEVRDARVAQTARKTLGRLVEEFLGSHLVSGEPKALPEKTVDNPNGAATFSFHIRLSLSEVEFVQARRDLDDLVKLRNGLVHNFTDQHDLWSVEGCRGAQAALIVAYDRIDQSYGRLREWAENMERARQTAAEFAQSDALRDAVINGDAPDEMDD